MAVAAQAASMARPPEVTLASLVVSAFGGGSSSSATASAASSLAQSAGGDGSAINFKLTDFTSADRSTPESLTFLGARVPSAIRKNLQAAFIIAEPAVKCPEGIPNLRVTSVHAAMSMLLKVFADRCEPLRPDWKPCGLENRIAATAVVEGVLEGNVTVGHGAFIGPGAYIGSGSVIEPRAVIQGGVIVGRNCLVQSGVVLGCAGFGFVSGPNGMEAMPHPAGVVIGDECWIGANSVVAAGVLHPTELGRGCKLDSHVQIAHNVRMGSDCLLASQSGIAGSTRVGDRLRMGGAASIDGRLHLGDDVTVAACSGVTKDFPDGVTVAGFPARLIGEWRRQMVGERKPPA